MLELVTIDQARQHLRLDADSSGGPDDAWLEVFIPAISQAVVLWLKDSWRLYEPELDSGGEPVLDSDGNPIPLIDSDGEPVVKSVVRAACLIELASQYRYREGEGKDSVVTPDAGYGYVLNKASTALLAGIRRPVVR